MSDHERGAYTPPTSDAPLSFDPRQPVRGARPIPLTLVLSVVVLAGLVAAIFMFYQSGVRQAGQPPQAVGAPVDGIKTAAPPEAQPQDPAAGLQIYRSEGEAGPMDTAPQPTFAPPPEEPQARPTTPVVVAQAPPARPAPPAAAPQAIRPALPAAPAPTPKVAAAPPQPKAAAPAPPPRKAPPPEPRPAPAGGAVVQIGAVSSTALADQAWKDATAIAGGSGHGKSVEKIEKNGATLYRTAVTGFASREAAVAFCGKLKAAGKSCFVR